MSTQIPTTLKSDSFPQKESPK